MRVLNKNKPEIENMDREWQPKGGFTLVELSIVLVIIGLLIGGILVAQSMVLTVKVQRLVRDLGQYEIAVMNFKTNYNYYPGDAPFFEPPGNKNNALASSGFGTGGCNGAFSNSEQYQAWAHLSQAKMIDKTYSAYSPVTCDGGEHTSTDWDSGKYWPHTDLSASAAEIMGRKTYSIGASKSSPDTNFTFSFFANVSYVIPMEVKMGATVYDGTQQQTGLVNFASFMAPGRELGYCIDQNLSSGGQFVKCTSKHADSGVLYYYLAPQ